MGGLAQNYQMVVCNWVKGLDPRSTQAESTTVLKAAARQKGRREKWVEWVERFDPK